MELADAALEPRSGHDGEPARRGEVPPRGGKDEFENFLERTDGSLRQGGDRGGGSRSDELQPRHQRRDRKQQRSACLHGVEPQVDSG